MGSIAKRLALWLLLLQVGGWGCAQGLPSLAYPMGHYLPPLRGPLGLSGSFGEVRSRHFHAGTDLRTGGREGKPVYAVAPGRVVRINVSTSGYGLALYIAHPNGSTSVYGHLQRFTPPLARWVRQQLYAHKRHTMELYPSSGWTVKAGELIGYSGNTGSSGGPHLHFELRAAGGTLPYNSVLSGVRYADSVPPHFRRLYAYGIDTLAYEPSLLGRVGWSVQCVGRGEYEVRDTVPLSAVAGLGVEVRDTVNAQSLLCNAAEVRLYVDTSELFAFSIDHIAFGETGYADAHIDYALWAQERTRAHLLFRLPGNALSRSAAVGGGLLRLDSGALVRVRVVARDGMGNASTLRLVACGTGELAHYPWPDSARRVGWRTGDTLEGPDYWVRIPARALYYDLPVGVEAEWPDSSAFAPRVSVHREGKPLHKGLELGLRVRHLPKALLEKLFLARWEEKRQRYEYYAAAGPMGGGRYGAKANDFGSYTLQLDTVGPAIAPKSLRSICGRVLSGQGALRVRVEDATSRVVRIDGTLDGRWMLWEFEPKTGEAVHWLEAGGAVRNQRHDWVLRITDALGNVTQHQCAFTW